MFILKKPLLKCSCFIGRVFCCLFWPKDHIYTYLDEKYATTTNGTEYRVLNRTEPFYVCQYISHGTVPY